MNANKLPRLPIVVVGAVSLIASSIAYISPCSAQSSNAPVGAFPSPLSNRESPDFSGDGRPGDRTGGGSRTPCPEVDAPLTTALIPTNNLGKTIAEHPTFWFYVPYSSQAAPIGEFVLQEEDGNEVYRTTFTLPKTPGLVSFSTPLAVEPLKINKSYHWYFKLYCEAKRASTPIFVEGWVQRVERTPALTRQLQASPTREDVVYAANGIWYDALNYLAKLRLNNPSNPTFNEEWSRLLSAKGVGLEQFRQVSVIGEVILPLSREPYTNSE